MSSHVLVKFIGPDDPSMVGFRVMEQAAYLLWMVPEVVDCTVTLAMNGEEAAVLIRFFGEQWGEFPSF